MKELKVTKKKMIEAGFWNDYLTPTNKFLEVYNKLEENEIIPITNIIDSIFDEDDNYKLIFFILSCVLRNSAKYEKRNFTIDMVQNICYKYNEILGDRTINKKTFQIKRFFFIFGYSKKRTPIEPLILWLDGLRKYGVTNEMSKPPLYNLPSTIKTLISELIKTLNEINIEQPDVFLPTQEEVYSKKKYNKLYQWYTRVFLGLRFKIDQFCDSFIDQRTIKTNDSDFWQIVLLLRTHHNLDLLQKNKQSFLKYFQ